ncbi:MAG: hypothetical protein A2908_03795 [Candidatus Staskawiczbacteria bacterium RIFCSPLOWO2_01_FULL_38_12b]|uniref:Helicase HerA central domain-containing protein n=1 Tax=Candidatus Staskawiczbacteria bacterium RIFCSPLOWO2_01_FULL_38_12b TaxID=1802214 RepID=A0A1G2ICE2_9BACT|nr:MAG: hypothetical protein A2908_03795 [Candidatus Staskawiczbacteria bacterium RIFCSPLOWO2_01_FULL_38_12b]
MLNKINSKIMIELPQKPRILVFIANVLLAWLVFFVANGGWSPFSTGAGIWLLAAMAYWLLVLITTPFFTPPKDSLATAISVVLLLVPIDFSKVLQFRLLLQSIDIVTIILSLVIVILALIAIFKQSASEDDLVGKISYQLSNRLGRGEILFTPVILISALGFNQESIYWALLISGFWVLMVVVKPVEIIAKLVIYFQELKSGQQKVLRTVGHIFRIDDPNIIRIILTNNAVTWEKHKVHIIHLPNNEYAHVLPLFIQLQGEKIIGTGFFSVVSEAPPFKTNPGYIYEYEGNGLAVALIEKLSGVSGDSEIIGLIVEHSVIGNIKFQVIAGAELEEGKVIFANVRGKKIYYQILDAKTDEESFKENPLGIHIVSAAQLGSYDSGKGFEKFPWLPSMNQLLFLMSENYVPEQVLKENEFVIGKVPGTNFGVSVILDDLIEYHSAVLGITGTGKTELVFDIIKNALKRGTKVFCVDFTGEYRFRLSASMPELIGLSVVQVEKMEKALFAVETGTYGAKEERVVLQKFLDEIKPGVKDQVELFIADDLKRLGIFEFAEITNTKATLRTTEMYLSAIMDWARNNRKAQQILIVLEEAHTIIPEAYGSGFDNDTQWVVGRIGQIALQGRKYGVGLLLVSQRTALVSKTILSQCNTYLTHSLVDKTSLDYLNGVYNSEHVQVIPNLRPREFLAHGKAVKSERPIVVRVDFDPQKEKASQALNKSIKIIGKEIKSVGLEELSEESPGLEDDINYDEISFVEQDNQVEEVDPEDLLF